MDKEDDIIRMFPNLSSRFQSADDKLAETKGVKLDIEQQGLLESENLHVGNPIFPIPYGRKNGTRYVRFSFLMVKLLRRTSIAIMCKHNFQKDQMLQLHYHWSFVMYLNELALEGSPLDGRVKIRSENNLRFCESVLTANLDQMKYRR
eukprot:gene4706-5760_t